MERIERQTIAKWKGWILAARPKTFTIPLIPIFAATALAQGSFYIALFAALSAICIQIGMHYINDVLDFKKGIDTADRVGPQRMSSTGVIPLPTLYNAGLCFLGLALLFGIPLIIKGGWIISIILAVSASLGYLYTGGPYPLSHYGLADLFVFLFFGLVITAAVYFVQAGHWSYLSLLAGAQIGALATLIMAMNNLRDFYTDAKAGKKTFAVRVGLFFARVEVTLLAIAPYLLGLLWISSNYALAALLPFLTFPIALNILKNIWTTPPGKNYNIYFKKAVQLHLLFGLFLGLSLL